MTPKALHQAVKLSVQTFATPSQSIAIRALIESGGVEGFLTDLLFIQLHLNGFKVARELPLGGWPTADIGIYGKKRLYIEAKQLNLKDGCKWAPGSLARDLTRHKEQEALGVLYIVDERKSTSERGYNRFAGANRRAKWCPERVFEELPKYFAGIYPRLFPKSLLRTFPPLAECKDDGGLLLYGFVVKTPISLTPELQ